MSTRTVRSGPGRSTADRWSSPETAAAALAHLQAIATPGGEATASARDLAAALHIGANTAKRALRRLIDTGRLRIDRVGTGRDYPTRYRLIDNAPAATDNAA